VLVACGGSLGALLFAFGEPADLDAVQASEIPITMKMEASNVTSRALERMNAIELMISMMPLRRRQHYFRAEESAMKSVLVVLTSTSMDRHN
jgi:hypothetical protein